MDKLSATDLLLYKKVQELIKNYNLIANAQQELIISHFTEVYGLKEGDKLEDDGSITRVAQLATLKEVKKTNE